MPNQLSTTSIPVHRGREDGGHAPKFYESRRIFRNFEASSKNFRCFAVGKNKGFEFYRKILELGPLPYMCQDAPASIYCFLAELCNLLPNSDAPAHYAPVFENMPPKFGFLQESQLVQFQLLDLA